MRDDATTDRVMFKPIWTLQVADLPTAQIAPAGHVTNMTEGDTPEPTSIFKTLHFGYSTADETDETHELDIEGTVDLRNYSESMLDASIFECD